MNQNLYLTHNLGASAKNNAASFSHCTVSGHIHSSFETAHHADHYNLRWSMITGWLGDPKAVVFEYNKQHKKKRPISGCGAVIGSKYRALVISDTHAPYHHKDTIPFLLAVREELELDHVLHVGDIQENHIPSYHEVEYGSLSAKEELKRARDFCQELESHMPKMKISEGNHDSLSKRKAKTLGIPIESLKSYNDNLGVGKGWEWADSHYINIGNAQPLLCPMVLKTNGRWCGKVL